MKKIIFYFVPLIFLILSSCKKETQTSAVDLIKGKWTGINKITKRTLGNPSTNINNIFYDTSFGANTGSNFYIDFKVDSLASIGHYVFSNSSYVDLIIGSIKYTLTAKTISFPLNPFTTEGVPNNSGHILSKINELTNNKLVLYDVDTIQPSPSLVVYEVWWNFRR